MSAIPAPPRPPALTRAEFLRLLAGGALLAAASGPARAGDPSGEARMRTRSIPSSGEALPVVGLGTWISFDVEASEAALAPRREVLRLLFAGGGSVIDSSPMYGRAESVVGALLAETGTRGRAFLATKVWTQGRDAGIAQMRRSMRRLGAGMDGAAPLDLMQIHNLVDWRTHLSTLRAMKEASEIRYIGITHYTPSALDALTGILEAEPGIDFVQFAYSIATRDAERRLLPLCAERGIAFLANQPYDSGAVFRRVRGTALPEWAAGFADSWGRFFLKFILAHPAVTCVIPGTDDPKHMADNLGAGYGRLPDAEERRRMVSFWESL